MSVDMHALTVLELLNCKMDSNSGLYTSGNWHNAL